MSALQVNSILFDSISGSPTLEGSGQVWYDVTTGKLNIQTDAGIKSLIYSGEVTGASTFQDIYNNTGNASSFTLGNGGSFTINDQNNPLLVLNDDGTVSLIPGVAGGNAYIGSPTNSGNLTVYGDFTVLGTTTTLNSQTVTTTDNIILLNSGELGAGITLGSGGITIARGSLNNASLLFDEGTDKWTINDGTTTYNIATTTDLINSGNLLNATKQPLDATLTSLAAYNTNGFLVQTAADTFAGRTLSQGSGVVIINANGVAGNPNISVDFSNINLNSFTGTLDIAHGGTNSTTALNNNRVMISSAGAIVEAAAIPASRALVSNANGIPVASEVSLTELNYVSGVTSSIQTQFTNVDNKFTIVSGDIINRVPIVKAGVVAGSSFAGNPKTATVTFTTAFADANYSIAIISEANRTWTVSSVAAGSFVINANSNTGLTGNNVYWTATKHGEKP